jgi:hypothetical protein
MIYYRKTLSSSGPKLTAVQLWLQIEYLLNKIFENSLDNPLNLCGVHE